MIVDVIVDVIAPVIDDVNVNLIATVIVIDPALTTEPTWCTQLLE